MQYKNFICTMSFLTLAFNTWAMDSNLQDRSNSYKFPDQDCRPLTNNFTSLLDMNEEIIGKALDFLKNQESYKENEGVIFISSRHKNLGEITQLLNHDTNQYIIVSEDEKLEKSLEFRYDLKKKMDLRSPYQLQSIILYPKEVTEPMNIQDDINPHNTVAFIKNNCVGMHTNCPHQILSIELPYRLSHWSGCSATSFYTKETLKDIYRQVAYRWSCRHDAIENGVAKDEDEFLTQIGKYSKPNSSILAFIGGYSYK